MVDTCKDQSCLEVLSYFLLQDIKGDLHFACGKIITLQPLCYKSILIIQVLNAACSYNMYVFICVVSPSYLCHLD